MHPIKMIPAFRHGTDTPWGGTALREVFGKPIPDDTTGESLEVSVLPGLCSRDPDGKGLDVWWREGGEAFRGTKVGETFPLLLKLIHARQRLSVQVHPKDAYAGLHEGGKLGKTEAWVILQAQPGARLVYGIVPGVTREALAHAAAQGAALEDCLRWIEVQTGNVLYIPAGMVHAIGEGILLYEIQQSSDVTYRFWDWGRLDEKGNPRQLHLQKGLDVTDETLWLEPCVGTGAPASGGARTRLIDDPIFTLDRLDVAGRMPMAAMPERFRLLTALCPGEVTYPGGGCGFVPGDSFFIPASSPAFEICCEGELLLAAPGAAPQEKGKGGAEPASPR